MDSVENINRANRFTLTIIVGTNKFTGINIAWKDRFTRQTLIGQTGLFGKKVCASGFT